MKYAFESSEIWKRSKLLSDKLSFKSQALYDTVNDVRPYTDKRVYEFSC